VIRTINCRFGLSATRLSTPSHSCSASGLTPNCPAMMSFGVFPMSAPWFQIHFAAPHRRTPASVLGTIFRLRFSQWLEEPR